MIDLNTQLSEMTAVPDIRPNDLVMSKEMADALNTAYPGYRWGVQCLGEQGVANIFNLDVSGERAYRIRLVAIYSASQLKAKVIEAGGNILERYRLNRGAMKEDQLANLMVDQFGRARGDLSK